MSKVRSIAIATSITAAVSTFGDYLWANVIPHHEPIYGLAHGVILFLTVGACLGAPVRKAATGALGAALVGLLAAGSWYVLQPFIGYWSAMFVVWLALWVMLGILAVRVLQGRAVSREVAVRAAAAAIGSGLAFYAISGIWRPNDPRGWGYLVHFLSWTIAFLPAFVALLGFAREPR